MRTFSREKAVPNSGGYVARVPSYKNPETDWVTLEIYTVGQTAVHLINGEVMLAVYNTRLYENGTTRPLTSGKIQIQSEGSEVYLPQHRAGADQGAAGLAECAGVHEREVAGDGLSRVSFPGCSRPGPSSRRSSPPFPRRVEPGARRLGHAAHD